MKKESIMLRIAIVFFIILGLLIPLFMVQNLTDERESYRDQAVTEIEKSWAGDQILAGPIITSQSSQMQQNKNGEFYTVTVTNHYLPDSLLVNGNVSPETRYRGIYEAVLYSAKMKITGSFNLKNLNKRKQKGGDEKYFLSFNISDLRGIKNKITLKINGTETEVNPGAKGSVFNKGFYTDFTPDPGTDVYSFEINLDLNGSENLSFVPLGKFTEAEVKSDWATPSFFGDFLPAARAISSNGFSSKWQVNYFNRDYPQEWLNRTYEVFPSAFGVKFLTPVDEYQKSIRASKYGIMIIMLTFLSFFLIEIVSGKALHPVQYLLIGLGLVIFYSLLVSLSEYMRFQYSYVIAAVMVIAMISFYVKSVFDSIKLGSVISGLLTGVYGFMYVILQLEDYSLLLGNIALFTILGLVMFLTRKVDWSEVFSKGHSDPYNPQQ